MPRDAADRPLLLAARACWRWGVVVPLIAALATLALASVFPLRLDQRNFQDLRRTGALPLRGGVPYLFVSAADDANAYRFAGYVLHNLSYPDPERAWLMLAPGEGRAAHAWRLDEQGGLWERRAPAADRRLAPERLARYVAGGVVLFDDAAVRLEAERRCPSLARARQAYVLAPAHAPAFVFRPPAGEFSATRVARLTALLGLVSLLFALLRRGWPSGVGPRMVRRDALALAFAVPSAVAVLLWGLSASQAVPLRAPGIWPYVLWLAAAVALALRTWREAARGTHGGRLPDAPVARRALLALIFALSFGAALFVARLDFDEDAHSHWMLMARSYYDVGSHVPERLQGHIHAATYPFGFAETLALSAWAADLPTERFLGLDAGTSLALLLYRLGMAALHLAVLGLLGLHVAGCAPNSRLALAAVALAVAVFPTFQGRHIAAETLLFPLLAAALLALAIGRRHAQPRVVALGLFLGGVATLVKLEGALLLALAVLPWWFAPGDSAPRGRRAGLLPLSALACGLLPTALWRLTLGIPNSVYRAPGLANLLPALGLVPVVASACVQALLKEGFAWLPFAALPLSAARRLATRPAHVARLAVLIVPASVWIGLAVLGSIYLFTTLPPVWQVQVSYARLALIPLFSALLYGVETLALDDSRSAAARGDQG